MVPTGPGRTSVRHCSHSEVPDQPQELTATAQGGVLCYRGHRHREARLPAQSPEKQPEVPELDPIPEGDPRVPTVPTGALCPQAWLTPKERLHGVRTQAGCSEPGHAAAEPDLLVKPWSPA